MIKNVDFQNTIEQSFLKYAASIAQERAIPDVRDMLKIGLRQGLYAQYTNKLTHKDKFQKAQKSVSAAMSQSYVHGDTAMYDTLIRIARPWSARYPLEEVQGQYGNQSSPDSHAQPRYVEMRSGELANYMFAGLKQDAIHEWYNNYDDTEQIPSVFPSIGYWNIVNGCQGIAVAMATSCPQFNLKEVNNALCKLIKNPNATFDEIYCPPDFATGGTITNKSAVKESLRIGKGDAIRIRATLTYEPSQHMIRATNLPYGVFTNTVIDQIAAVVNDNPDYGIDNVTDYTKDVADIHIYLSKGANPNKIIAKLYKDTSLENWFAINMVLLDEGRFPKIFGWREACTAYIKHIRECEKNILQYELDKALARKNVIDGLLIAAANIDEVVAIIRASDNPSEAADKLIARFSFNDPQVKAILAMKLSSLTRIDSIKLSDELEEIKQKIEELKYLLSEPTALDEKLIEQLNLVSEKFGDERRTKLEDTLEAEEEPEEIKEQDIMIVCKGLSSFKLQEKTTTRVQKDIIYTTNLGSLTLLTKEGKMYNTSISKLKIGKEYKMNEVFEIGLEHPCLFIDTLTFNAFKSLTCITKNGFIKKSHLSEYTTRSKKGVAIIKLEDGDSVIKTVLSSNDDDNIVVYSKTHYNCYPLSEISYTGRSTKGVKAIKLEKGEYVIDAQLTNDNKYEVTGRAVKGVKYGKEVHNTV